MTKYPAHTYDGVPFSKDSLKTLLPSFAASYSKSIREHSQKCFLKCYDRTTVLEKSFYEFDVDVQKARAAIESVLNEEKILVTIGTNTYLHTVYLIAGHLSNLTLCPINGEESPESIERKLRLLPHQALVWADSDQPPALSRTVHCMNLNKDALPAFTSDFPKNQPMVLIFTSGSTGYSKIVQQMEENILSNVDALIEHHQMQNSPGPVIGTSLPLFHVNTLEFSFFTTLLSGCRLVLFKRFDLISVITSLQKDQISVLSLIPTLIRVMIDRFSDFSTVTRQSLKYVVSAAAPLSGKVAKTFIDRYQIPIIQGYGLSEAVNFSALLPTRAPLTEITSWLTSFPHPSIGPALRGNEIQIMNSSGQPCGPGQIGEVCIRGWNVMKGYTDSVEALFEDGFLHTGDLGYFQLNTDGIPYYFISGRIKDVIKRNGETVSLREIDDLVLPLLTANVDAIAVGFENDFSGEDVGLMVYSESLQKDSIAQTAFLLKLEALPKLLRPSAVIFYSEALRTASGKPQRWKFKDQFKKFQDQFLGSRIKSENSI